MTQTELEAKLQELMALDDECEWVEWKHNNKNPQEIGEYLSAISNSSALHSKELGYIIWGIDDKSHEVVGTKFKPRKMKIEKQELENWLAVKLSPKIDFHMHEFLSDGMAMVMFEVQPAFSRPVSFRGEEYIRIGSYKKKLKDHPEKERALWKVLDKTGFERAIAVSNATSDEVLSLLDYPAFFELLGQKLPDNRSGILESLRKEKLIVSQGSDRFKITNLGGILFAKNLLDFDALARKTVRIIFYKGTSRVITIRENEHSQGYANGFENLIQFINDQLPKQEEIEQALRREIVLYPPIAIRELVANMLIHQDFTISGTGATVEVFEDRIEITNPGTPVISPLRFIDEPPQSRNEPLAKLMRRLNICEERGTGIDKVITAIEALKLPAPDFLETPQHTKVILYPPKSYSEMSREDRVRACYQHACLCHENNQLMTNTSLRERFGIEEANSAMVSRIIKETIKEGLIKPTDPESKSRRHASYKPQWA